MSIVSESNIRLKCAETGNLLEIVSSRTVAHLLMAMMNCRRRSIYLRIIRLNLARDSMRSSTVLMAVDVNSFMTRI